MRAWTLMTAMPPTKGHFNLMEFVSFLEPNKRSKIIACTQPGEPFAYERYTALSQAAYRTNGADVIWLNRSLPQDPTTPGFWGMWKDIMTDLGFKPGDTFVSSETYGAKLAEVCGGVFMPFDPYRELIPAKGTDVRFNLLKNFDKVLPEFQQHLRTTVTIFGAESTGKTTLSKELAATINGHWIFEWARPYMETVGTTIDTTSMSKIWHGQYAAQRTAKQMFDKPFVVQDTDLYSTIGYWEQPHWIDQLGPVPRDLINDAKKTQSDLYIITRANIPFEEDPLRYGGDHRESPDEFWIDIAEKYRLPYKVLDYDTITERCSWSAAWAKQTFNDKNAVLKYDRKGF